MWGFMRDWCRTGRLPDDRDRAADLTGVEYDYNNKDEILSKKKDDMKKRGLASPDDGDALALALAYPVAMRDWRTDALI